MARASRNGRPAKRTNNKINPREERNIYNISNNNLIELNFKKSAKKKIEIIPRSVVQEDYLEALEDDSVNIVISTGPAGTGKSMLATEYALKAFNEGLYDKIVITRPALPSEGESLGALPGGILEKMSPWVKNITSDIMGKYYSMSEVENLIKNETIELAPIAYIRGRTISRAIIILDEAQNLTPQALKAVLTRIGEGSKIVVTGDTNQSDRGGSNNGLQDFLNKLENNPSSRIKVIKFSKKDIQRHPVITDVLKVYGE